jgi:hypothetical protein
MADDHNQRPYRGNERIPSGAAPASASDPLAELARLIGQNDPFSEFGGNGAKRAAAAPRQAEPAQQGWPPEPAQHAPRQSYGSAPVSPASDVYHVEGQSPGYEAQGYESQGYQAQGYQAGYPAEQPGQSYGVPEHEVPGYGAPGYEAHGFPVAATNSAYEQDPLQPAGQQRGADDDYYDDVPPNRRRIGILAIAGVFALAVIGTAGAFGYRAIFGSSSSSSPPPVIKAEQAPSKIVPAATSRDAQSKISERANSPGERLVSREEQPVVVTTTNAVSSQPVGSGVVGSEPKRIRTIAIKPDQPADAGLPPPVDSIPSPTAQPRVISTTPQRPVAAPAPAAAPAAAPARVAAPNPAPAPMPEPAAPAARAEAPANAPLSLNPNAAPARNAAPAPQRAAAIAPPPGAASGGSGVYAVQVSAQRSEEEAQAAFRSLQGKFPGQLGNRQLLIKRVDAGEKGIFFGAQVGPFTDAAQAKQMCESLKAAGGSCLVKRN